MVSAQLCLHDRQLASVELKALSRLLDPAICVQELVGDMWRPVVMPLLNCRLHLKGLCMAVAKEGM